MRSERLPICWLVVIGGDDGDVGAAEALRPEESLKWP